MASTILKHFSGAVELSNVESLTRSEFDALFPGTEPGDQMAMFFMVGRRGGKLVPVQRSVAYARSPSRHVCGAQCMFATGPSCECSCNGRNHGLGHHGGLTLANLECEEV